MADKTVYVDGTTSSGHYASLQAAITGEVSANPDLTAAGMNGILNIEISMTTADTTAVYITGFTTDATHYINIYTTAGARHAGVWSTSKYRLEAVPANNAGVITIQAANIIIDGLQIYVADSNDGYAASGITSGVNQTVPANANWTIRNNICKGNLNRTYNNNWHNGIECGYSTWSGTNTVKFYNNIVYDFKCSSSSFYSEGFDFDYSSLSGGTRTDYFYNNTAINCDYGIYAWTAVPVAKNNIMYSNSVAGYMGSYDASSTNNLASDTTAPEFNTYYDSKTLVFSGTGDYRIAATDFDALNKGACLYSDANCPVTIDITGRARHATGAFDLGAYHQPQLLKTVKPTGGNYTALETCMNANEQDLVAADKYFDVEIDGDWSGGADTPVVIDNYTTDATHYINIYTTAAARHNGVWDNSKYRIEGEHCYCLDTYSNVLKVDGLQIKLTANNGGGRYRAILSRAVGTLAGKNTICNNILVGVISNETSAAGFDGWSGYADNKIFNNIIYGFNTADSCGIFFYDVNSYAYNNTVYGCAYGISAQAGVIVAKNNICYDNTIADYVGSYFDSSSTNNLSSDDTAPEFNTYYDSKTLTFSGTGDYRIAATDFDALNKGACLYSDANCPVTTDITGRARHSTGAFDLGAYHQPRLLKTVKPTGGDYTALETCMHANEQDLVTADKYFDVEIDGDWSGGADTTAVVIAGYTTDATHYINIYTTIAARHSGVWSDSKYRLVTTGSIALRPQTGYIRVSGLQLGGDNYAFNTWPGSIGIYYFNNNIARSSAAWTPIIVFQGFSSDSIIYCYNNIIYGYGVDTSTAISFDAGMTIYCYNNTLASVYFGFYSSSDSILYTKNNIISAADAFYGTFTDDDAYNDYNSISQNENNVAIGSHGYYNQTFVFEDPDNDDYRLDSTDTAAIDHGADLHLDTYCPFTTDIAGTTRTGTWDIGAFEYIASGVANTGFFGLM